MHTSFFWYAHEKFPVCTRETFGVHTEIFTNRTNLFVRLAKRLLSVYKMHSFG